MYINIVISIQHNKHYFPNNSPLHFQVCLDQYIDFKHAHKCALVDFTCTQQQILRQPLQPIYIYLQLISGSRNSLVRYTTVRHG